MDKLRECPFCGGEAGIKRRDTSGWYIYEYKAGCKGCGIETPDTYDSEDAATAAWNRRTELKPYPNDHRTAALILVDSERNRQDAKWGEQNHAPQYWVGILREEFCKYCEAVNETVLNNGPSERAKGGYDNMMRELKHVAAVAVSAMECLMRERSMAHE